MKKRRKGRVGPVASNPDNHEDKREAGGELYKKRERVPFVAFDHRFS